MERDRHGRLPFEMLDLQKKRICSVASLQQTLSGGKELRARNLGN